MLAATGMPETWQSGGLEATATLANREPAAPARRSASASTRCARSTRPSASPPSPAVASSATPHFVAKVADNEGAVLLDNAGDAGEQVIDQDVANDVTYALRTSPTTPTGASTAAARWPARPAPQGLDRTRTTPTPGWSATRPRSRRRSGSAATAASRSSTSAGRIIYGSGLPGAIWQQFMNAVLDGTPEEDLPDEPLIEGDAGEGVPEPEPEPTELGAPTPRPAPATEDARRRTDDDGSDDRTRTTTTRRRRRSRRIRPRRPDDRGPGATARPTRPADREGGQPATPTAAAAAGNG